MKNEIKEILDKLNSGVWEKDEQEISYKILFSNEVYQLLYYITNLQEENERLKEYRESYRKELDFWRIQFSNKEEVIDKAIEYIKENSYFEGNEIKTMIYQDYSKYILEILQGKSDE